MCTVTRCVPPSSSGQPRFDVIVTDAPYGIRHGSRADKLSAHQVSC